MSSSTYFNTGKINPARVYHIADLDKASLNRFQRMRDDNNNYNHSMSRKGGFHTPVPVYSNEAQTNPEIMNIPRFADNRHRVMENRRQKQFHNSHGELTSRPYQ